MGLKISIITPSYNQVKFLPECLRSVQKQSLPVMEHLIYDPGSTDGSRDLVAKFPHANLIAESDQGQSDAVSKGFLAAKGDIIGWLNSDDCYTTSDVVEAVVKRFQEPDSPDIVYGRGTYINEHSKPIRDAYVNESPETLSWRLHQEVGILQPALFMKRSVIEKIGTLSEDLNFCMDYEYWIRAVQAGLKFVFIPKTLAYARYYEDNKTLGQRGKSLQEICDTVKSQFGYVHIRWIGRYAEFLAEGFDGILKNSKNTFTTNKEVVEDKINKLLTIYNTDYDTLKLLKKNCNTKPYKETFEALKKRDLNNRSFCHEIPIDRKTFPNSYCYTVGERRWAFDKTWKNDRVQKTQKAFEKFRSSRKKDICIIVGNGPSLNQTSLDLLEDQDVFISNYAFLNSKLLRYGTYLAVTNYLVAEQGSHKFNSLENIVKLFPYWLGYCINEDEHTFFFNSIGYPEFSKDINQNVSWRSTVSFFHMQIAYWLGYQKVLLIGFDHSYSQDVVSKEGDILVCDENDKNHFDSRYFKGKRWQAADVRNMEAMYSLAKEAFEEDGKIIINCTVGGSLEIFPRSSLEEELTKHSSYKKQEHFCIQSFNDDIKNVLTFANSYMIQEKWGQAIALYREILSKHSKHLKQPGAVYEQLGEALMHYRHFQNTFQRNCKEFQTLQEYQEEVLSQWKKEIKSEYSNNKIFSNQDSESNFPRVLIVARIKFNQQAGGGVTMGNLFRGWPLDKIAQIHTDQMTQTDWSVCQNYLYIPYPPTNINLVSSKQVNQDEFIPKYLFPWEKVLDWCRHFSPDIIYARPSDEPSFYWWLPQELANQLNIPYVTHIMDDWPARFNKRKDLESDLIWKPRLNKYLQSLLDNSSVNIGISKEMCAAYQKRYGRDFVPFHNCINVSDWSVVEKDYKTQEAPEFTLLYIGVVTPDKELGSLKDIRDAVLSIKKQGYSIRFHIYSAKFWQKTIQYYLEHLPEIAYCGYVNPSELPKVLSQADLLILPINFDEASLIYVGYSLQTKVPEYMASGTPTLVYGPSSNPNVRYASDANWGFVVEQKDREKLEKSIIELIENPDLRKQKGQYARKLAFQNHDASVIRDKFRKLMYNTVISCIRR